MARRPRFARRMVFGALLPVGVLSVAAGWTRLPGVVVAALIVALTVAVLAARRMHDVIQEATVTARQYASGRFGARMATRGPDDIRDLAESVNAIGLASARREEELGSAFDSAANQRDLFHSIINASSDGLLAYDNARQLIAVNQRCGDLLGFTLEELLNEDVESLRRSVEERCEQPARYLSLLERHFERPAQPHQDMLVLREPRRRVLRRYSCPILNHRGVQGRVFTYTDVTAETDLDRMKSEFVSMASHELRTPLTSVHGALQLALSGSGHLLQAEDRELLEISLANTERLVRLVNDLLDLSKIEAGRMPFLLRPLVPKALMDEAAKGMQGLATTRQSTVLADESAVAAQVAGDRDHLLRVLTNLVSNALKYSPPGSTVRLATRAVDEGVEFSVLDEGPGIPPDQLDRLFRPFSRLGVQERQTGGGTGLGLAISRAIVEQHGGRIWVERAHPAGSRFAFVLPASRSHPDHPARSRDVA